MKGCTMSTEDLDAIVERARTDAAFFASLVDGSVLRESSEVSTALRSGLSERTDREHNAYGGCNTTSCGCGGSI
jgi:hypothetical protein